MLMRSIGSSGVGIISFWGEFFGLKGLCINFSRKLFCFLTMVILNK